MDVNSYPLSRRLGLILKKKNMKLAVVESCTGGGLCLAITRIPGSSTWFECGFIAYSDRAKEILLDIDPQLIKKESTTSKVIAREMAVGALKKSHADIAISITGIAGPNGKSHDQSIGTIWCGIAKKTGIIQCYNACFNSGRKHVQDSAIVYGLRCLITFLQSNKYVYRN
ncbi:CinA family protein [Coxiella endosymbiont of Amblyomma americanum]|uniref:CinA family protein n=1 Tax=Coxiella endosymbiont of Amblyomma americanum TaxID=325775 RepID=UPI00057ED936|nr:CinA family protein [Coxiella endosymbiont of Amblyomma americanum]AJC50573.1 damage-inducible protein CinA [Coxiella endosymbiont of Amblyomma americanum]AUJ58906.1 CinA family protein [Coxiella-like endosymbiont of Amblyomma americanum]